MTLTVTRQTLISFMIDKERCIYLEAPSGVRIVQLLCDHSVSLSQINSAQEEIEKIKILFRGVFVSIRKKKKTKLMRAVMLYPSYNKIEENPLK